MGPLQLGHDLEQGAIIFPFRIQFAWYLLSVHFPKLNGWLREAQSMTCGRFDSQQVSKLDAGQTLVALEQMANILSGCRGPTLVGM